MDTSNTSFTGIKSLPSEAVALILNRLNYRALFDAELVCRAWHAHVQPLWRREYDLVYRDRDGMRGELLARAVRSQVGWAYASAEGSDSPHSPAPSLANSSPKRALLDYYFSLNFLRRGPLVDIYQPPDPDPAKAAVKLVIVGDGAVCYCSALIWYCCLESGYDLLFSYAY
jgi:hypothetical protein